MSSSSESSDLTPEPYEIVIYKIQHRTNPEAHPCYVGSTKDFKTRMRKHEAACNNPNVKDYKYRVYRYIRANGGWDSWEMNDLATEYVESKHEQYDIENNYINLLDAKLNGPRPGEAHRQGGLKQYNSNRAKKCFQEKFICPCGIPTNKHHKARHEGSDRHKQRMAELVNQPKIYNPINKAGTVNITNNITINNYEYKPGDKPLSESL